MVSSEQFFWLDTFSVDGAWKRGLDDGTVSTVLSQVTSDEIEAIRRELELHKLSADQICLTNLLCHWTKLSLDERELSGHPNDDKETRARARTLAAVLGKLDEMLSENGTSSLAYPLSKHIQHPLPYHYGRELIDALTSATKELRPTMESLASTSFRRGPKPDWRTQLEVEGLIAIFEYLTGKSVSRTYDPIADGEVGPFRAFAERAMRLLDENETRPIDWAIRKALEDRAKNLGGGT